MWTDKQKRRSHWKGDKFMYYMIYDYQRETILSNFVCATRAIANWWCDKLEKIYGYEPCTLAPIKFDAKGNQISEV